MNSQTLRYYERRCLLPEPARTLAGYREFDEAAVARMQSIKRAQSVGFTLAEVETLLHLSAGRQTDCHGARELAREKSADLDQRIRDHCPMLAELSEGQLS